MGLLCCDLMEKLQNIGWFSDHLQIKMRAIIWDHIWLIWVINEAIIGEETVRAESAPPPPRFRMTKNPALIRVNEMRYSHENLLTYWRLLNEFLVNGVTLREKNNPEKAAILLNFWSILGRAYWSRKVWIWLHPGLNHSQSLTDTNFAPLWPTDPTFSSLWNILSPLDKHIKSSTRFI